jgi:hypothetical protein
MASQPVLIFSSLGSILGVGGLAILIWQLYTRYIFGEKAWSIGWTWLGNLTVISLMLKRMERRLMRLTRSPP